MVKYFYIILFPVLCYSQSVGDLVEILRIPKQAYNQHMQPSLNPWTIISITETGVNVQSADTTAFLENIWADPESEDQFWQINNSQIPTYNKEFNITRHYLVSHSQPLIDINGSSIQINYDLDVAIDYQISLLYNTSEIITCTVKVSDIFIYNSRFPAYSFIAGMQGYPILEYQVQSTSIASGVTTNTSTGIERESFLFSNIGFGTDFSISVPINFGVLYQTVSDPSGLNRSLGPSFPFQSAIYEAFRISN